MVVRVDTDLAVPSALNRIEIQVTPEHGGQTTDSFTIGSRAALPATLAIRPSGSPSFNIDVTARGLLGGTSVVTQTATVPFFPGEAREITLFLSQDCAAPMPCTTPGQVCIAGGTCVAKTQVAQPTPYIADAGRDGPRDAGGGLDVRGRDARDNPAQWVAVSPAFPSPTATLNGVWPIDNTNVWVVGYVQPRGIAARFSQGQWIDTTLPAGTPTLYGVWASSASDVWAVGVAGTVLHFDGNSWSPVSISGPSPTQVMSGVWGTPDGGDVWVVGAGGIVLHGTKSGLSPETSTVTADLTSVWGVGNNEVWAVGSRGTAIRRNADRRHVDGAEPQAHAEHPLRRLAVGPHRRVGRGRPRDVALRRQRLGFGRQPARHRHQRVGQRRRRRLDGVAARWRRRARRSSRASTASVGCRPPRRRTRRCKRCAARRLATCGPSATAALSCILQ